MATRVHLIKNYKFIKKKIKFFFLKKKLKKNKKKKKKKTKGALATPGPSKGGHPTSGEYL
jgi:hypothetical protein